MRNIERSRYWWLPALTALMLGPTVACTSSAGSSCSITDNADGTSTLTCNGKSVTIGGAENPADAGPGAGPGAACSISRTEAGSVLTCGDASVPIPDGPGPGAPCSVAQADGGSILTCGDASVPIPPPDYDPPAPDAGLPNLPVDDVTSGANGCAAAIGNGSADDTAAIQCQIDYLNTTHAGGFLFFPQGSYKITSTIHVKGAVTLVGAGQAISVITTANADIVALNFDVGCNYAGVRDMWIVGKHDSSSPANNVVHVSNNVPVIIRDSRIWGGNFALDTAGVDGLYEDVYFAGWGNSGGGGINSTGANWYVRDKIDQGATPTTYAFRQQAYFPGTGVAENHFIQTDFSGTYSYSVVISDGGTNSAITVFNGCVFSSPIVINNGRWTSINNAEIGSGLLQLNDGSWLSITGSYAFSPTTVSGAGTNRACSGNVNIGC